MNEIIDTLQKERHTEVKSIFQTKTSHLIITKKVYTNIQKNLVNQFKPEKAKMFIQL